MNLGSLPSHLGEDSLHWNSSVQILLTGPTSLKFVVQEYWITLPKCVVPFNSSAEPYGRDGSLPQSTSKNALKIRDNEWTKQTNQFTSFPETDSDGKFYFDESDFKLWICKLHCISLYITYLLGNFLVSVPAFKYQDCMLFDVKF